MSRPGAFGSSLADLARVLLQNGPHKTFTPSRRIRVILNHSVIVDTTQAQYIWEHPGFPQIYIPWKELKNSTSTDLEWIKSETIAQAAAIVQLTVPAAEGVEERKTDRVLRFVDDNALGPLAGLVRLEFGSMDQWLEEDVPIFAHPKDPFKRLELLPSSRPIQVKVGGKTVAKAASSVHLHETGLPVRYYLSLGAVDQSVLRKSDLTTICPYKGVAEYYHVVVDGQTFENVVWYYNHPTQESFGITGLLSFYNEKVTILIDEEAK